MSDEEKERIILNILDQSIRFPGFYFQGMADLRERIETGRIVTESETYWLQLSIFNNWLEKRKKEKRKYFKIGEFLRKTYETQEN